jgi:hypothetical protein
MILPNNKTRYYQWLMKKDYRDFFVTYIGCFFAPEMFKVR